LGLVIGGLHLPLVACQSLLDVRQKWLTHFHIAPPKTNNENRLKDCLLLHDPLLATKSFGLARELASLVGTILDLFLYNLLKEVD